MPSLFTDRRNGSSIAPYESFNLALHVGDAQASVVQNRKALTQLVGNPIQFMNQVHGDEVLEVSEIVENPTCDALITTKHGIALAVLVADCIPLLLISSNVIAAVHVGRRGLANSIAIKTVETMRALGATDIKANLGPSICGRCYEVSQEIAADFKNFKPTAISTSRAGTLALDLPRALIADLVEIGVQVQSSDICTLEDSNYFSYRRNNLTGRTAGVIWL